jgi:hypothetical protein
MCHDGTDVACDDQVDCTDNSCSEEEDRCVFVPQQNACLANQVCDPLSDCIADELVYANTSSTLYRVDLSGAEPVVTQVGSFGAQITDIAETPEGAVYGISFHQFYEINADTGQATYRFDLGVNSMNGLTMAPTGEIFCGSGTGSDSTFSTIGSLYLVPSELQGSLTHVGRFGEADGTAMASSGDIVWGPLGAIFVTDAQATGPDRLLSVNPMSGRASVVGTTNHQDIYGLSFVGGRLIGFTGTDGAAAGKIIEINPRTGASETLLETPGKLWWGAT